MLHPHIHPMKQLLALLLAPVAALASEAWLTDLDAAKKQAVAEKKDILVLFTGSDWCAWSQRLNREVFDTVEFAAQRRFVLVKADFPRESELPAADAERNKALKEAWSIAGFPTVVLANAAGQPYAQTGYKQGGPGYYLRVLDFLARRNTPEGLVIYRETPQQTQAREAAHKEKLMALLTKGDFDAVCRQLEAHYVYDKGGMVLIPFNKAVMSHALAPTETQRSLKFIDEAIAEAEKSGPQQLITMMRLKRAEIVRGE